MEVVPKETGSAACQANRKCSYKELPVIRGDSEDGQAGYRSDPSGKAVHVVEEVDRVGDADEPQDRQTHVEELARGHDHTDADRPDRHCSRNLGHDAPHR